MHKDLQNDTTSFKFNVGDKVERGSKLYTVTGRGQGADGEAFYEIVGYWRTNPVEIVPEIELKPAGDPETYQRCVACRHYFSPSYPMHGDECEDCYEKRCLDCYVCGRHFDMRREHFRIEGGKVFCSRCTEKYFERCTSCGRLVLYTNVILHKGEKFCSHECIERHERARYLQSASYKPDLIFCKMKDEKNPDGYYGVELEVEGGWALALEHLSGNRVIYFKKDSSLDPNSGVEIVTHPMTIRYHHESLGWEEITQELLINGYMATENCGLHIHASRTLFGETEMERDFTIAKILLLVDRWWDKYIVPFSRRDIKMLEKYACKPNCDIEEHDTLSTAQEKMYEMCSQRGRYTAINLMNKDTVEFRFIRSTISADKILAALEFVDTLIRGAKKLVMCEMQSISFQDMFGNTQWPELHDYLVMHELIED